MEDKLKYVCPRHKVLLKKKSVMYGMPIDGYDYGDVIFGGCCVDEHRKFGYVCPVNDVIYYLDREGKLYTGDEEDLDEGYQI